jgi:hypothetical protein
LNSDENLSKWSAKAAVSVTAIDACREHHQQSEEDTIAGISHPFLGQIYWSKTTQWKPKLFATYPGGLKQSIPGRHYIEVLLNAARALNFPLITSLARIKLNEVVLEGREFASALSVWVPPTYTVLPGTPVQVCINRIVRAASFRKVVEETPLQAASEMPTLRHFSSPLTHVEGNRSKDSESAQNI